MQLTLSGVPLPRAAATSVASARWRSRSVKPMPRNAPTPSLSRSRRGVPSQLRVGSGMRVVLSCSSVSAGGSVVEDKLRRVDQGPEEVFGGGLTRRAFGGEGGEGDFELVRARVAG